MSTIRREFSQISSPTSHRHTLDSESSPEGFANQQLETSYYRKKAHRYRRRVRIYSNLLRGLALCWVASWFLTGFMSHAAPGAEPPQGPLMPPELSAENEHSLLWHVRDWESFRLLRGQFKDAVDDGSKITLAHFGWTFRDAEDALNLKYGARMIVQGETEAAKEARKDLGMYVDDYLILPWRDGSLCKEGGLFEREICEYAVKRFTKHHRDFLRKGERGGAWSWIGL